MHTKNMLISILRELGVSFTNSFAAQSYEEHPYKYTFYGLKSLCEKYGITTEGLFIYNKENIQELPLPFIAKYNNDYALVKVVTKQKVTFEMYGTDISMPSEQFQNNWSGHVLLFSPNENSVEPDYRKHIIQERKKLIELYVLAICALALLGQFVISRSFSNTLEIMLLLLYMCGCILSGMLILQQMKINNPLLDSVCHAFKNSSCNNVLESKAAKFMGQYSWSEIGFSYFFVNVIALCTSGQAQNTLAQIAILAIPYGKF